MFNLVRLEGTEYGASTDENGLYNIVKVKPGNYQLVCQSLGYDTFKVNITIVAGKILSQNIFLENKGYTLGAVEITAETQEKKLEVKISETKITPKDIKALPSVGGETDLAQYLQVLPGVIFTGDQGGQLYIRGGSPIQNKVLMDGMTIYNPFHTIGLFSVFETDIIKTANVYSGGFDAKYSGRISSVVDISTKDGNKKRFSGKVSSSPFMSRILIEGPITKMKEEGGSSLSYILTSKYSYLDKISKSIYPWVDSANHLPYGFLDGYAKISLNSSNGSKVSLFGFNYNDHVNYPISTYKWKSFGTGLSFVVVPNQGKTVMKFLLAYSDYDASFDKKDNKPKESSIGGINANIDLKYYFPKAELEYGLSFNGFKTTFNFYNDLGLIIDQDQNTTEIGGYVSYRYSGEKIVFEPSIRLDYYASLAEFAPEPRFKLKWNISNRLKFKLGTGLFHQNFISSKSDKDVINLFTGFLSAPDEALNKLDGAESKSRLQSSWHVITGLELAIGKNVEVNVEPYYKRFTQLIDLNRNKVSASESNYMIETGDAYGIDFSFRYDLKRLYIWAVYSLGYNNRKFLSSNGIQEYHPHYDRRHNVNLVTTYQLDKRKKWEASARWNLGSGFPFTKTQGFYEYFDFQDGLSTDYTQTNGQLGVIYDQNLNTGRLPYYHRLDLSVTRKWLLSEYSRFEATAALTNVYDRKNIFYFDRVNYERVNQLPILPSLALNFYF